MPTAVEMSYSDMTNAVTVFKNGEAQFEETLATIQQIAGLLQDGALLGQAGSQLADSLTGTWTSRLSNGATKMGDLAKELQGAMGDLQAADSQGASGFGD